MEEVNMAINSTLSMMDVVSIMYCSIFSKRELIELYMVVDNDLDKKIIGEALDGYPMIGEKNG